MILRTTTWRQSTVRRTDPGTRSRSRVVPVRGRRRSGVCLLVIHKTGDDNPRRVPRPGYCMYIKGGGAGRKEKERFGCV